MNFITEHPQIASNLMVAAVTDYEMRLGHVMPLETLRQYRPLRKVMSEEDIEKLMLRLTHSNILAFADDPERQIEYGITAGMTASGISGRLM